jgi:hypothetical protein
MFGKGESLNTRSKTGNTDKEGGLFKNRELEGKRVDSSSAQ